MFEHSLGNYDTFPLLYECKPHRIRNFKFSENLRPLKLLIDLCPLCIHKVFCHCYTLYMLYFSYKLIGQNVISDTLDDRQVTVNITKSARIPVQPGDFIGMYCFVL